MFSIDKRGTMKKAVINILCLLFGFSLCFAQVRQDPYSTYNTSVYGSAIQAQALTNLAISTSSAQSTMYGRVAFKFKAQHTGSLTGIRVYVMGTGYAARYGGGNGGTWRITLRHDSTANHTPAQLSMTSTDEALWDYRKDGTTHFPLFTFDSPANVDSGTVYHIVFENIDPDPNSNYSSINTLFRFPVLSPQQPFASDDDWLLLESVNAPYTTWQADPYQVTPIMGYYFTDGYSTGMGYMEVWSEDPHTISGNSAVRETFTVTGKNRSANAVAIYLRKISGTENLNIRLEKTDGTLLEQGTIPASSIPTSYSWISSSFQLTQTLTVGQSYNLTLSTASNTSYDAYAIWNGQKYFGPNTCFNDGYAQFTTDGSNWTGWDQTGWDRHDGDLSFYFSNGFTNLPTGTLNVTPKNLPTGGGVVTLQWTSHNATSAVIDNGLGTVPLNGNDTITVTANTTFKLTLTGPSGSVTYTDNVILTNQPIPIGKLTVPDTLRLASIPGTVRLQWTSQNANTATIDNGVGAVQVPNGYIDKPIFNSTTYTLTLSGASGLTATSVARVIVLINQQSPPIGTFTVTPNVVPLGGGNVTLQWTSQNATSAFIDNGIGTVQLNGSKTVPITANTVFKLTLNGQYGSTTYVDTVIVSDHPLPTGTFTASPDTVPFNGGKITFSWTSQNATTALMNNDIGPVIFNGSISKWVYNTTAFMLILIGPGGSTTYIDSVFVRKPPTGTFTITPHTLPAGGGGVTLQWTSLNATSAIIDNNIGIVKPNGSCTATIPTNTVYKLTLNGPGGSLTLVDSAIISMQPTGKFTVTPDTLPDVPGTVTLQWTSENATKITINPIIGTLNETSGSKTVTVTNNTIFELTLFGQSGLTTTYIDTVIVLKPIAGIRVIGASPLNYVLSQNYPNPFNPTTIIEYALPHAGFTTLKIYNALGVMVTSLLSGYLQPGRYAIEWDASKFASGMYFCRLQTGAFTATKKLVLIR
jgi:hypothetical protein